MGQDPVHWEIGQYAGHHLRRISIPMKFTLQPVLPRRSAAAVAAHWYRVEHRDDLGHHDLGRVPNVAPTHHALTPFLAHLLRDGATGELVLIDETTGADVARRFLTDPRRRGSP
jgi:hypothetical protein